MDGPSRTSLEGSMADNSHNSPRSRRDSAPFLSDDNRSPGGAGDGGSGNQFWESPGTEKPIRDRDRYNRDLLKEIFAFSSDIIVIIKKQNESYSASSLKDLGSFEQVVEMSDRGFEWLLEVNKIFAKKFFNVVVFQYDKYKPQNVHGYHRMRERNLPLIKSYLFKKVEGYLAECEREQSTAELGDLKSVPSGEFSKYRTIVVCPTLTEEYFAVERANLKKLLGPIFSTYELKRRMTAIGGDDDSNNDLGKSFEFNEMLQHSQLYIEFKEMNFPELDQSESLHFLVALHNPIDKIRISEDFEFRLNLPGTAVQPEYVKDDDSSVVNGPHFANMGSRCVVSVTGEFQSYYSLILIVSRIFEYTKKTKKNDSCAPDVGKRQLAFSRIPYCWGAITAFYTGQGISTLSEITNFYPIKALVSFEEIYDCISTKDLRKIKNVPGHIALKLYGMKANGNPLIEMRMVDPCLNPLLELAQNLQYSEPNFDHTSYSSHRYERAPFFDLSCIKTSKITGRNSVVRLLQEIDPRNKEVMIKPINNLYIHPKYLTFKNKNLTGAKISIFIEAKFKDSDRSVGDPGLCNWYGGCFCPKYVNVVSSMIVTSERKQAKFLDQFKLRLPLLLDPNHHVLFTFYEMDTKKMSFDIIGYSVLPLVDSKFRMQLRGEGGQLMNGLELGFYQHLPSNYLGYLKDQTSLNGSSESKRRVFRLDVHLVSSMYSVYRDLFDFFSLYRRFPKKEDHEGLLASLQQLECLEANVVFKHFPLVFNLIISLMCTDAVDAEIFVKGPKNSNSFQNSLAFKAFMTLVKLVSKLASIPGKESLYLASYAKCMFDNDFFCDWATPLDDAPRGDGGDDSLVPLMPYKALSKQLVIGLLCVDSGLDVNVLEHGWFLFSLIVRSMVLDLDRRGMLPNLNERRDLFPEEFVATLNVLIKALLNRRNTGMNARYVINMAQFITKLLPIVNPEPIVSIIGDYLTDSSIRSKDGVVRERYKLIFLKVLTTYPHWNQTSSFALSLDELGSLNEFWEIFNQKNVLMHRLVEKVNDLYLSVSVIQEILNETGPVSQSVNDFLKLRGQAITVLRTVMYRTELNLRWEDDEKQKLLASMYFSFIRCLVADPSVLSEMVPSEREDWLICFFYVVKYCKRLLILKWWSLETHKNQLSFLSILELCLSNFQRYRLYKQISYVILDLVYLLVKYFAPEFVAADSVIVGDKSLASFGVDRGGEAGVVGCSGTFLRDPTSNYGGTRNLGTSLSDGAYLILKKMVTLLSMVSGKFVSNYLSRSKVHRKSSDHVEKFQISTLVAPMQMLIDRCACVLPSAPWNLLVSLLIELLSYCNSSESCHIRSYGASMLFLLFWRIHASFGGDFSRLKIDITVAISKLLGGSSISRRGLYNPLRASLDRIMKFVAMDPKDGAESRWNHTFVENVNDVLTNAINLLDYNIRLEQVNNDSEMIQELYLSIGKTFEGNPELCITWIDNLSRWYLDHEYFEEAGHCKIQIASLLVEYLMHIETPLGHSMRMRLPQDFSRFPLTTPSINFSIKTSTLSFSQTPNWNMKHLIEVLQMAAVCFESATKYELALEVYHSMMTLHMLEHKWEEMAATSRMQEKLCRMLNDVKSPVERSYPVYFTVAFYGRNWSDLDGKQFIYKKKAKYNLSVFMRQLEEQYRWRIDGGCSREAQKERRLRKKESGKNSKSILITDVEEAPSGLEILSFGDHLDVSILDPDKAYIRMTGVTPYFDPDESEYRISRISQNWKVDKFLYEIVFTDKDGTAVLDDLSQLKKRKIIYKTDGYYPNIKTRLKVIEAQEIILSPIENAIELIETQVTKIRAELETIPTRTKSLQQIIQGSVVPMVNPGPLKICEIFLNQNSILNDKYPPHLLRRLCDEMNKFVKMCGFAIKLNKSYIDDTQVKFQEMVEEFYGNLKATVKSSVNQVLDSIQIQ